MRTACIFLTIAMLAGCTARPTIYYWGNYENSIYTMYAKPGSADPQTQILKMEEDIQKARGANKRVPPGIYAHLGYLFFQLGKLDQARDAFQMEKTEFPESAVLMDHLLARL